MQTYSNVCLQPRVFCLRIAASLLLAATCIISTRVAQADPLPTFDCKKLDEHSKKGELSQALKLVHEYQGLLEDQLIEKISSLMPESVGAFHLDKMNFGKTAELPVEMQKLKRATGNSASYRAEGLPVMRVSIMSNEVGASIGKFQCQENGGGTVLNAGEVIDINGRRAILSKFGSQLSTVTLCLKGGSIQTSSESASKEQFVQFLKDFPPTTLSALDTLFAPFATSGK